MVVINSVYPVLLEIQKNYPNLSFIEYIQEDYKIFQFAEADKDGKFVKIFTNIITGGILFLTKNKIMTKEALASDEIYLFKDDIHSIYQQ